jgi:hypothetical protein
MRLLDLVDVDEWCDRHETSQEVGEAMARRIGGYDPEELERLWASPTEEEFEDIKRNASNINVDGPEILHWGVISWKRGDAHMEALCP